MDQRLRRDLDAIAADRSSGAVELAQRACVALQQWVRPHPRISRDDLLAVARALLFAQPAMALLLRLANEVALVAEECPVWVLADTSKLLPRAIDAIRAGRNGPDAEIWPDAPKRLSILNPYFERTRYQPGIRILTERGWRTPAQIRREIQAIKVSPLLATLARHPPH